MSKEKILPNCDQCCGSFQDLYPHCEVHGMLLRPMSLGTLAYPDTFLSRTEIGLNVVNILTIITWRNLQQEYFSLEEEWSEAIDGHDDMSL